METAAIEKAIDCLAGKITVDTKSEDALRYTQAALNLAHVLSVRTGIMKQEEEKK